ARWISSLVVCGLAGVALHMSGTTSSRAAMAQDRTSEQDKPALRQVTVGVPRSFPPYYLLDEYGNPSGFAVDAMNEVAKRAGFEVTYRVAENGGANFKAIRAGDIDIIPSLGINDYRKQYVAFTQPVDTFRIVLFIRDDTQDITSIDDMAGRPVAVVVDNVGYRFLEKKRPDIQLEVFPLFADALFALLSGKVDAFAYPEPVTWKLAREAKVADQIKVAAKPLFETKRAMAVRKDRTELLATLDSAVRDFISSPEYQKVYLAWFGKPDPYWTVVRVAWTMGGVIVVLFVLMVWWRYRVGVRMIQVSQKSEKRLRGAIESLQEGFLLLDAEDRLVAINDVYREINPQAQEFLDKGMRFEDVIRANVAAGRMVEALGREEEFIRERLEQHRNPGPPILRQYNDGKWYIIKETRTPDGGIAITFSDITERKRAEDKIKTALAEKEVLLSEIHHRVKNNLQVISSMLLLQANADNHTHTVEVLRDSYRRVMLLGQIHASLHRQDDLNVISARDFLNTLVTNTKVSGGGVWEHLSFHVDVDEIPLDVDHANAYGQIVSELISNSLKHAFANGQPGNVLVSLRQMDGGVTKLTVADDGKGLPKDFDLQKTTTLGLRLVRSLTAKLGGEIKIVGLGGTRVQINIPEERP
ncbi:MAG: transporter substrate-binding domain-containing protein, partial [Phycisphaerae bacterium]